LGLTAGFVALRTLSARVTAHCGCTPPSEYEGLPHTGQAGGFWLTMLGLLMLLMDRVSSGPREDDCIGRLRSTHTFDDGAKKPAWLNPLAEIRR
jgi:hypothetical protein